MMHDTLPTNAKKTLKYHLVLVTTEPSFTVKMIDCMQQTGLGMEHGILQYVTLMLNVFQVCHGVGHCVNKLVSTVVDGPRDALCQLKSYQLFRETQLPQTQCAMLMLQSTYA